MAEAVASVVVELTAQSAQLRTEIEKARRHLKGSVDAMQRDLKRMGSQFDAVGRSVARMAGALVGGGAVAAVTMLSKRAIEAADSLADTAAMLGVTTESLQALRFAGTQAGVGVAEMDKGLRKVQGAIADAIQGTGDLSKVADVLGLKFTNADGSTRSLEQNLGQLADAVKAAKNPADQLTIATAAFGERGAVMVNILRQGSDGIAELTGQAQRAGAVIDSELTERVGSMQDAFEAMGASVDAAAIRMMSALVPATNALANAFATATTHAGLAMEAIAGQQSRSGLDYQVKKAEEFLAALKETAAQRGAIGGMLMGGQDQRNIAQAEAELARLRAARAALGDPSGPSVGGGPGIAERIKQQDDAQKAAKEALTEATRRQEAIERQLAQNRAQAFEASAAAMEVESRWLTENEDKRRAEAKALQDYIGDLQFEYEQLGKNAEQRSVDAAIRRANVDAMSAEGQQIARISAETSKLEQAQKAAADATADAKDAARELGLTFTSAFEDAVISGNGLRDVLRGLLQDIQRIILRKAVTEPLAGKASGLLGSIFGGLFGGGGGASGFAPGALSFMADGGSLTPGQPTIVGERGPEMIVPSRGGTVIPNHALGGSTTVNVFQDLRNSSRDAALMLRAERENIVQAARAAVAADLRQGGGLARLTGGRA